MSVVVITPETVESEILSSPIPVLIDFGASWCKPCKEFKPIFHAAAKQYAGKVKFVFIDIDDNPDAMELWEVKRIPHLIVLKDRKIMKSHKGGINRKELDEFLGNL